MRKIGWLLPLLLLSVTTVVQGAAAVDSFRIRQLYSSQDGDYQFIELEEVGGRNNENHFAMLKLSVTDSHGRVKTFEFSSDLPNALTANKHVLIMSETHATAGANHDFVMPNRFLPTDGGTLDLAEIDHWTFRAIPNGGELYRDEHPIPSGIAQTFDGRFVGCCWGFNGSAREYYNATLDQYFMSSMAPDIEALESGRIAGWKQIGPLFHVWSTSWGDGDSPMLPSPLPVCRYFIPPASHFFSVSAEECDSVAQRYPGFVLEIRDPFYAYLPDATTGECPVVANEFAIGTRPVYRLWNSRVDTNHRFTTSLAVRAQMLEQGWVSEGYGPDGVAMCVSPQ